MISDQKKLINSTVIKVNKFGDDPQQATFPTRKSSL